MPDASQLTDAQLAQAAASYGMRYAPAPQAPAGPAGVASAAQLSDAQLAQAAASYGMQYRPAPAPQIAPGVPETPAMARAIAIATGAANTATGVEMTMRDYLRSHPALMTPPPAIIKEIPSSSTDPYGDPADQSSPMTYAGDGPDSISPGPVARPSAGPAPGGLLATAEGLIHRYLVQGTPAERSALAVPFRAVAQLPAAAGSLLTGLPAMLKQQALAASATIQANDDLLTAGDPMSGNPAARAQAQANIARAQAEQRAADAGLSPAFLPPSLQDAAKGVPLSQIARGIGDNWLYHPGEAIVDTALAGGALLDGGAHVGGFLRGEPALALGERGDMAPSQAGAKPTAIRAARPATAPAAPSPEQYAPSYAPTGAGVPASAPAPPVPAAPYRLADSPLAGAKVSSPEDIEALKAQIAGQGQASGQTQASGQADQAAGPGSGPIPGRNAEAVSGPADIERVAQTHFGQTPDQAKATAAIVHAYATTWAERAGADPADWYRQHLAGVGTSSVADIPGFAQTRAAEMASQGVSAPFNAGTQFLSGGKAFVSAIERPNFSSMLHEMAHVWQRTLTPAELQAATDYVSDKTGVPADPGEWTEAHHEAFADAFERYLYDGAAPSRGLKGVFQNVAGFFRSVYQGIAGTRLRDAMSPQIRGVFDSMLGGKSLGGYDGAAPSPARAGDGSEFTDAQNAAVSQPQAGSAGAKTPQFKAPQFTSDGASPAQAAPDAQTGPGAAAPQAQPAPGYISYNPGMDRLGLARAYAGAGAKVVFQDALHKDLYDLGSKITSRARGNMTSAPQAAIDGIAAHIARQTGDTVDGAKTRAGQAYLDARAQMQGVAPGEARSVVETNRPHPTAPGANGADRAATGQFITKRPSSRSAFAQAEAAGQQSLPLAQRTPVRPVRAAQMAGMGMEEQPGGVYIDPRSGEVLNDRTYASVRIDALKGKPSMVADDEDTQTPAAVRGPGDRLVKTNMFKQKAGWSWVQRPQGYDLPDHPELPLVSIETGGQHFYTLATDQRSARLATYPASSSEPRLRPTTYGVPTLGRRVGEISVRGKSHPVYDHIGISPSGERGPAGAALAQRGKDDAPEGSGAGASAAGPGAFYSHLARVVEQKMGGAMTAESLGAMLRAGGVKPDELKWSGMDDLLAANRGQKITRAQVLSHLERNGLGVDEVRHGTTPGGREEEYPGAIRWKAHPLDPDHLQGTAGSGESYSIYPVTDGDGNANGSWLRYDDGNVDRILDRHDSVEDAKEAAQEHLDTEGLWTKPQDDTIYARYAIPAARTTGKSS